jgi:hypothetical protein
MVLLGLDISEWKYILDPEGNTWGKGTEISPVVRAHRCVRCIGLARLSLARISLCARLLDSHLDHLIHCEGIEEEHNLFCGDCRSMWAPKGGAGWTNNGNNGDSNICNSTLQEVMRSKERLTGLVRTSHGQSGHC